VSLPPIALAVLVLEACGWVLLLPAAWTAVRVLERWDASTASAAQLALERRTEASSLLGRGAVALFGLASLVLLVALLLALPRIVPGAMCATGVLAALPEGRVMVGLRVVTAVAAVVWARLDALSRRAPVATLTLGTARALLVLVVLAAVSSQRTAAALLGLDLDRTVSCCTVLYDLVAVRPSATSRPWLSGPNAALGTVMAGLLVATLALRAGWRAHRRRIGVAIPTERSAVLLGFGAASLAWMVLASSALVDWTGPYVLGAIGHRCPWCLFLPIHGGYGWWAWGVLLLGGREATALITTEAAARAEPELRRVADRWNVRSSGWLVALTLLLLVLLVAPVLHWRWQTGADVFG
jgi:hypothetical protein